MTARAGGTRGGTRRGRSRDGRGGAAGEFFAALVAVSDADPARAFAGPVGPAPVRADIAGAAVALGRAIDALGGRGALPRSGPAILVIAVTSAGWVGPVAEEVMLGDVTAGSAEDLAAATRLAILMETRLGFSRDAPLLAFGLDDAPELWRVPWAAAAVHRRLSMAYEVALDLVRTHRAALERLSEALREKGHLGDAEIRGLLVAPRRRRERADRPHRPLGSGALPGDPRKPP